MIFFKNILLFYIILLYKVLFDPGTAFSLIVGHEVGGCTKEAFSSIAGRFMLPLCDHFTADFVWDALVRIGCCQLMHWVHSSSPNFRSSCTHEL